jgi:D-tyrosyl-tRNA(Tyr) deacylase
MRAVVQRVRNATLSVDGQEVSALEHGLLAYVGVGNHDGSDDVRWLVDKIAHLRVFEDSLGAMNLSIADLCLGAMVISQFTLFADARKGRRPSFSDAASPELAKPLVDSVVAELEKMGIRCAKGVFGANMRVSYVNEGPVTILLDSKKTF